MSPVSSKIALFIDGANLYATAKTLGFDIDYKRLLNEFQGRADELRRQADAFTDLVELKSKLGRDPSERPAPREPRHHAPQFLQRATTMAPRADDDDFDD